MPVKYQDYLAAEILSESNIVSYRGLSRALKVSSNAAKEMLYEFHRSQNARKPGSIHASYLIAGAWKPEWATKDAGASNGDTVTSATDSFGTLPSSSVPEPESQTEQIPTTCFTLVKQEHLEKVKSLYESIVAMHIYSLEPGTLNDLQVLSSCNQKIAVESAAEDPLETWQQYGTIHNPAAKRRTNRLPSVTIPTPAITSAMKPQEPPKKATLATSAAPDAKTTDNRPAPRAEVKAEAKPASRGRARSITTKPAPALRRDSSSLVKSFAKTKERPKTSKPSAGTSRSASPAAEEDEPVADDANANEAALAPSAEAREKLNAQRTARAEREEELRRMMDDDDDDENDDDNNDANANVANDEIDSQQLLTDPDAEMPDWDATPPPDSTAPPASQDELPAVAAAEAPAAATRRRGRRRVTRKRTTKDAEGYLVTREEAAWESFSEDERAAAPAVAAPPPPAKKAKTTATTAVAAAAVPEGGRGGEKDGDRDAADERKGAGKKGAASAAARGQGNIMSFFAKK